MGKHVRQTDQTGFQQALERALAGTSQAEVARVADVAASTISTWLSRPGAAKPQQVFAVERALDLPPGHLSRHLGYVPVSVDRPPVDVIEAIEADGALDDPDRDALIFFYSFFKTRSIDRDSVNSIGEATTSSARRSPRSS